MFIGIKTFKSLSSVEFCTGEVNMVLKLQLAWLVDASRSFQPSFAQPSGVFALEVCPLVGAIARKCNAIKQSTDQGSFAH